MITHLHFDHAGGLELIPTRCRSTSSAPSGRPARTRRRSSETSSSPATTPTPADLVLVDGDHDLLGDGSVELLSTPGHTAGHQSVRVGDLVIGADVTHYSSTLDDRRFPLFADDHEAQGRSADRLQRAARRRPHRPARARPGGLEPGPLAV